jgi:hypothetical protein
MSTFGIHSNLFPEFKIRREALSSFKVKVIFSPFPPYAFFQRLFFHNSNYYLNNYITNICTHDVSHNRGTWDFENYPKTVR